MPQPKLWSCKRRIEMEDHAMSFIRNGYAVSPRRRFLGLLFFVVLGLVLFVPRAATAQDVKQIKLTEKQLQGFMAAYEDIAKLYEGAESDKPEDPKVEAQAAALAKKNGFASLAQYDDVLTNITMILSGIDPQTKKFTEPKDERFCTCTRARVMGSYSESEKASQHREMPSNAVAALLLSGRNRQRRLAQPS